MNSQTHKLRNSETQKLINSQTHKPQKYERPHVVCNCVRACFAISCSAFVRTAGRLNCLLRVRLALVGNQQAQHLQPVVAGNLLVQLA